ncbi:hypothetical protein H2201_000624 [Coniosporium apollinis]|uniref:Uncharacterized protein n=1 Tax=Coniosporium apollinis TaxID=61459 RepID=A0ABQ9P3T9_9PEZI|nr:hypothetical protein H2201_000624 [Coniosporium apollinis]
MELLVHISAPTTRKDDDRYKAQALAYDNFECSNRVSLTARTEGESKKNEGVQHIADLLSQDDSTTHLSTSIQREQNAAENVLSSGNLPGEPQLPEEISSAVPQDHVAGSLPGSSWPSMLRGTPLASSRRTEFVGLGSTFRSSKNPIQQLEILQSSHRKQQRSSGLNAPHARILSGQPASGSNAETSPVYIEDTQLAVAALESQVMASEFYEVPSSPLIGRASKRQRLSGSTASPASSEVGLAARDNSPQSSGSEAHEDVPSDIIGVPVEGSAASELSSELGPNHYGDSSSTPKAAFAIRASRQHYANAADPHGSRDPQTTGKQAAVCLSSPSERRIRRATHAGSDHPALEMADNSDQAAKFASSPKDQHQQAAEPEPEPLHRVPDAGPKNDPIPPASIDLSTLPMVYHAPPPETDSITDPGWPSQITPTLARVFEGVVANPSMILKRSTRAISPVERGYWHLDPSTWPPDIQAAFWRIVGDNIPHGNCGWNVWCTREASSEFPASAEIQSRGGLGVIRFWCWGEIVGHVWAFLVVASRRWVKWTGARWVAGRGEVVVEMEAVPRQPRGVEK